MAGRIPLIVLGIVAVLMGTACVKLGASSELPLSAVQPTPVPYDRINCDEILGTAFRSDAERTWFEENCSKWPVVKVGNEPSDASPTSSTQRSEPPECAQIRGRPYESNAQRTFYLQNCNQSTQLNGQVGGPDRTDCNAIRGTPYRSENERNWYDKNCANQQQQATSGPDRTNCDEIRGSAYRSVNERNWYIQNCRN